MKKTQSAALAAAVLTACLALSSCEFIDRILNNEPPSTNTQQVYTEKVSEAQTTAAEETPDGETAAAEAPEEQSAEAQGGNPVHTEYIEVTVSGEKYLYDNHETALGELTELFDTLGENVVVRLSDDNAAKKAYEAVTKALEERGLMFEEVKN